MALSLSSDQVFSHHLHHLHDGIDTQVVEEGDEVFFHLDTVVIHLSDSKNAYLALSPHLPDQKQVHAEIIKNVLTVFYFESGKILFHLLYSKHYVSDLMLAEQEWQQHQHASIMDNPPYIYVAFSEALAVGRIAGDIFRNQQGHTGHGRLSYHLCIGTDEYRFVKLHSARA